MNLTKSRSPLRIKAADIAADGTFFGYGSVFNVVDSGGDLIRPGAFSESLSRHAENGTRAKLLWQHYHDKPIGSWVEMREDDHGLLCRGKLLIDDVEKAREAYALMKAGELDGLSIGYECTEWDSVRSDELSTKYGIGQIGSYAVGQNSVRVLKTVDLWEVSVVTFPMNEAARVEAVKRHAAPAIPDLSRIAAALDRRQAILSA